MAVHVDQSGFDERIGVKYTPVYAGAKKNDCSPHAAFFPRAMGDLQKSIDDSYSTFCETVARNRGILAAAVKETEAGIFYGQGAIKAGLVDVIALRKDSFQSIALDLSKSAGPKASATTPKATTFNPAPAPKAKAQNPNALIEDAKKRAQAQVLEAFGNVAKASTPAATKTATVEELAQGFVRIDEFKASLTDDHQTIYNTLVDLQQEALSGSNVAAKIKKAKADLEDIGTKQEACERGMEQIKGLITPLIPVEAKGRIETLDADYDVLQAEERVLYRDFFTACARAIALREKIQGITHSFSSTNEMKEAAPQLDVQAWNRMNNEDSIFLIEQVKVAREEVGPFKPVEVRIGSIRNELGRLRGMLEDFNPETQTEKVIAAYR